MTSLRDRFYEEVARSRRDSLISGLGVLLLAALLIPLVGLLVYGVVAFLFNAKPPLDIFSGIFLAAFLGLGYLQYRRSVAGRSDDDSQWLEELTGRVYWWPTGEYVGCAVFVLMAFRWVPSLIFHLVAGLAEARHIFQSQEAEELAFDLITSAPERIPREVADAAYRTDAGTTRAAMQLLRHMSFVQIHHGDKGTSLLLTLRCQEFLEG